VSVPSAIQAAVDLLPTIEGVTIESSLEIITEQDCWSLHVRLSQESSSKYVPMSTAWVILIHRSYPSGSIRMYPARIGGLIYTFPHQDRNIDSNLGYATWRNGKPCLDSPTQRLGFIAGGPEPKLDSELRLQWHVRRCLQWLEMATENQLMAEGEPFEVPQCPNDPSNSGMTLVHDEGKDTFLAWKEHSGKYGKFRWRRLSGFPETTIVQEFLDAKDSTIRKCRCTPLPEDEFSIGYWWLWPSPIVNQPWHAPNTWEQLRRAGRSQHIRVDKVIRWLALQASGNKGDLLLLGYPIPGLWHGDSIEIHWQAIKLPDIPSKSRRKRFKNGLSGWFKHIQESVFGNQKELSYLNTSNWHPDRLQARGRYNKDIRDSSVALIGCGALGSAVAELLIRGGVRRLLLIDHDDLEVGNLVRHTLTGAEIGLKKASAIASRLQSAAPMSQISSLDDRLPSKVDLINLLESYEIVVDCSGEDVVLRSLSDAWWSIPKMFVSASVGYAAKHLFLFGSRNCAFPLDKFIESITPWLKKTRTEWMEKGETLEGVGCWSPLWPARSDDIWLASVATVKYLELLSIGSAKEGITVYEQRINDDNIGYVKSELTEQTIAEED